MSEWISVKDRLPPEASVVLVYEPVYRWEDEKGIDIKRYFESHLEPLDEPELTEAQVHAGEHWEKWDRDSERWDKVTYWMPLPNPPLENP